MRTQRAPLTNQKLAEEFANPFELVNTAIRMARHVIESGHTIEGPGDVRNQAHQILLKIGKKEEWKVEPVAHEDDD